jgi:hypothetical protein
VSDGGSGAPLTEAHGTTLRTLQANQLRDGLRERGTRPFPTVETYSLRKPGTSMSSSLTRSLRMSVSSAESRGPRLS